MWIRSQNKEKLINVNKFNIEYTYEIKKYGISGDNSLLGVYSTKEKALKVLDGIQKYICQKDHLQQEYGVIQMPQDEEVITNE